MWTWTGRALTTVGAAVAGWQFLHRRSPAVKGWSPSARTTLPVGPLATTGRDQNLDGPLILLLHGITASERSFGAAYDTLPGVILAPDLLGFGRSMSVETSTYSLADHVRAVEETIRSAGHDGRPTLVVGHSMGAVLALHVAAALPDVIGVVALSAPMYDSEAEGLDHIGEADPLASLVATGDLAERVCGLMCDHRQLARTVWPFLAPTWPRAVAADGVLHTWPAYRQSLQSLVLESDYDAALQQLEAADIPVHLVNGTADGVPVAGRAKTLANRYPGLDVSTVSGAGHPLPLSHPAECTDVIRRFLTT